MQIMHVVLFPSKNFSNMVTVKGFDVVPDKFDVDRFRT